jgi:hypothetical protein
MKDIESPLVYLILHNKYNNDLRRIRVYKLSCSYRNKGRERERKRKREKKRESVSLTILQGTNCWKPGHVLQAGR